MVFPRLSDVLVSADMYGKPISVLYKGRDSFKTMLGALLTLLTFALVIIYLVVLVTSLSDGTRQIESSSIQVFDRYFAGKFQLSDYQMRLAVFSTFFVPPEIGRLVISQQEGGSEQKLKLMTCKQDRREALMDFWSVRGLENISSMPNYYMQCPEEDAFLASEQYFKSNYAEILIKFEHCKEYQAPDLCSPDKDASDFWSSNLKQEIILHLEHEQLDMQNRTAPMQPVAQFFTITPQTGSMVDLQIEMQPNEFRAKDDSLGLSMGVDDSLKKFFTIKSAEKRVTKLGNVGQTVDSQQSTQLMPELQVQISLANTKGVYSRSTYSAFMLLSEIGGFLVAIAILPFLAMRCYSQRLLQSSLAKRRPTIDPDEPKQMPDQTPRRLRKVLMQEDGDQRQLQPAECLLKDDIDSIFKQVKAFTRPRVQTWKAFLSSCICCCQKDRGLRLFKDSWHQQERKLDILSLIKNRANMDLLLTALLSDEQKLLYRFQRKRAASLDEPSASETEDDNLGKEPLIELKQKFSILNGYRPTSRLDRHLLKGLFSGKSNQVKSQNIPIPSKQNIECDRTQLSDTNAMPLNTQGARIASQLSMGLAMNRSSQQLIPDTTSQQNVIILQDFTYNKQNENLSEVAANDGGNKRLRRGSEASTFRQVAPANRNMALKLPQSRHSDRSGNLVRSVSLRSSPAVRYPPMRLKKKFKEAAEL